ncbi:aspartyl/asparaginyl beta-hydroxylase domain-containing protein [Kribbella sp. CA-294648]|uniref:aspartyl/asparaginyl beta-hydroxylase domain-containing protein n=1 Tax=Kribbella sp. CA-294648 TaxID=3239948 RepID=UPI003D8BB29E
MDNKLVPVRKTNAVLDVHRRLIDRFDPTAQVRFFDPADFPWAAELEREWQVIRGDLDVALSRRDEVPEFSAISSRQKEIADSRWQTLVFHFFGRRVNANCERFPRTSEILSRVPDLTTAMFSILSEGAHIPPHFGPYKGILRYHLGLKVPSGARLRVDDQVRSWQEGKSLLFDDTFEHEAWNHGPGDRVVLFVDVVRPLPRGLDLFNRAFFQAAKHSPDVREVQMKASRAGRLRSGRS